MALLTLKSFQTKHNYSSTAFSTICGTLLCVSIKVSRLALF